MKTGKIVLTAVLAMSLGSVAHSASLTGAQLKKEYVGKSFTFKGPTGATGTVRYYKNGKARLSNTNFKPKSDKGTWRIKGNRICNTWTVIRKGKEKCFTITKIAPGKFKNQDGTTTTVK